MLKTAYCQYRRSKTLIDMCAKNACRCGNVNNSNTFYVIDITWLQLKQPPIVNIDVLKL